MARSPMSNDGNDKGTPKVANAAGLPVPAWAGRLVLSAGDLPGVAYSKRDPSSWAGPDFFEADASPWRLGEPEAAREGWNRAAWAWPKGVTYWGNGYGMNRLVRARGAGGRRRICSQSEGIVPAGTSARRKRLFLENFHNVMSFTANSVAFLHKGAPALACRRLWRCRRGERGEAGEEVVNIVHDLFYKN